jgi:hypothetical protein
VAAAFRNHPSWNGINLNHTLPISNVFRYPVLIQGMTKTAARHCVSLKLG